MANLEKIKDNLSVSATSSQRFQCYDERKPQRGKDFRTRDDFFLSLKSISRFSVLHEIPHVTHRPFRA